LVIVGAVSNRTYTVQYTDKLSVPTNVWTKLTDLVARSTNRTEVIVDSIGSTNRAYRLALPAQP
jgi:hypothetical protein